MAINPIGNARDDHDILCGIAHRMGVVPIATGAWYDSDSVTCLHGNPNVLTPDKSTSKLAQGPIAHSCLVSVEVAVGPLPEPRAFEPPQIIQDST